MKTVSVQDAVALIPDGARLMVGGFVCVGTPERLMDELVRQAKRNLTVITNDTGQPGLGVGKLVAAGLLRKVIVSHIGLNPETQQQMLAGKIEVDLVPQGTLIERIRSGGSGLGGILTPTGIGTVVEKDKRKIEVNGKEYLLETALRADFALIHAFVADYIGLVLIGIGSLATGIAVWEYRKVVRYLEGEAFREIAGVPGMRRVYPAMVGAVLLCLIGLLAFFTILAGGELPWPGKP